MYLPNEPKRILTSVNVYACSAVHSAFEVGLLRAKITGRSLNDAIDLINLSVKAPGMAAAPSSKILHMRKCQNQLHEISLDET